MNNNGIAACAGIMLGGALFTVMLPYSLAAATVIGASGFIAAGEATEKILDAVDAVQHHVPPGPPIGPQINVATNYVNQILGQISKYGIGIAALASLVLAIYFFGSCHSEEPKQCELSLKLSSEISFWAGCATTATAVSLAAYQVCKCI